MRDLPTHPVPPLADAAEAVWRAELEPALRCSVRISWTRARSRVISTRVAPIRTGPHARAAARDGAPALELRLASFFAQAPPEIRRATASWLRSGRRARRATRALDAWIAEAVARLPPRPLRLPEARPRGRIHDLAEIATELCREGLLPELGARADAPSLTWGRGRGCRARLALRLGSCDATRALIRIHPVLDQAAVPRGFVRLVVFHELLHLAIPPERDGSGRRSFHGAEFRRRERALADYRELRAWERDHVAALVRSARTGREIALGRGGGRGARRGAAVETVRQLDLFAP